MYTFFFYSEDSSTRNCYFLLFDTKLEAENEYDLQRNIAREAFQILDEDCELSMEVYEDSMDRFDIYDGDQCRTIFGFEEIRPNLHVAILES